jgi:hypothetical protein
MSVEKFFESVLDAQLVVASYVKGARVISEEPVADSSPERSAELSGLA